MSAHGHTAELTHEHAVGTTKLFAKVWVWLLLLTIVEVYLAYLRLPVPIMITILVGLSLIKAALIISYFMHMRFERLGSVPFADPGHGVLHLHDADHVLSG